MGWGVAEAGYWAAVPTAISVLGALLIPRFATPERRLWVLALLIAGAGATTLLLHLAPGPGLALGLVLQGLARGAMMTVALLLLVEVPGVGAKRAGTAGGLFFSAAEIGGVSGPVVIGLVHDATGGFLGRPGHADHRVPGAARVTLDFETLLERRDAAMTDTEDTLLCFSYGSNMSTAYLRETCPGAAPVMRAELANHRIEFRRFSTDLRGGLSTIMPAPGDLTPGVLFRVPRAEIEALDLLEDVDKGLYRRETHLVLGIDGAWHGAELYRVAQPRGPFPPATQYVGWMIEGAIEHGLDDRYIERLRTLLARPTQLSGQERHLEHWSAI